MRACIRACAGVCGRASVCVLVRVCAARVTVSPIILTVAALSFSMPAAHLRSIDSSPDDPDHVKFSYVWWLTAGIPGKTFFTLHEQPASERHGTAIVHAMCHQLFNTNLARTSTLREQLASKRHAAALAYVMMCHQL